MATPSPSELNAIRDALRRHSGWIMALGILWVVLGTAAIILPAAATLAADFFIGALLLIGGIAQLVQAWRARDWSGFLFHALGAVFAILAGAYLLLFPARGIVSLTIVLAAFFIASGVLRGWTALNHREIKGWGWLAVSAVLSIVVGVMIWLELPGSAVWALGLLVGIEFLFVGMGLIMFARGVQSTSN